jgi:hypothetical protein
MPQGPTGGAEEGDATSHSAPVESPTETTTEELELPPGMAINPQALELAASDSADNDNLDPEKRHSTSEV